MACLYALESTSYPVIVILSSFSWGMNLFASEIAKIASRYGFASGVIRDLKIYDASFKIKAFLMENKEWIICSPKNILNILPRSVNNATFGIFYVFRTTRTRQFPKLKYSPNHNPKPNSYDNALF